jgi:Family of unknown function (DUF6544)
MLFPAIAFGSVALCAACLFLWRLADGRHDRRVWKDLLRRAGSAGPPFDPSALAGLPEPGRRYLQYTIAAGTPLVSVVEIEMGGQLGLGNQAKPNYRAMTARQILAPPQGLVWRVRTGPISGSDGATPETSWTRFWLRHRLPIVRTAASADHHRSAFGRVVAEGAFWVPSSLLPSNHVSWTHVSHNTARATVSFDGYVQSIDLTVEADGRPSRIVIQRWSNANPDKVFREQPFGGYLSEFREFGGYRLPTRVEGGNLVGTEDYFAFYKAEIRAIHFPQLKQ